MKYLLMYLWQLPQNLLGALYRDLLAYKEKVYLVNNTEDFTLYAKDTSGSVTLGRHIFISSRAGSDTIKHETGHVKQSQILGPLYLPLIGIPSILWAAVHKKIAPNKSYYWFYTEKWANKLVRLLK